MATGERFGFRWWPGWLSGLLAFFANGAGAAPLHPDPRVVQRVLDDPVLRPVLPVEFSDPTARPPVIVTHARD